MIRIKDYIFNENEILAIHKDKMNGGIDFEYGNDKFKTFPDTSFEDIEWNYENFNDRKKLEEVILARDVRIKELEDRINKAIEYIGNGNIGIPKKTSEKFINILKGE